MNPQPREARRSGRVHLNISGDNSLRDPPVPIPNTEVKPQHADSTWVATPREGRSSPDSIFSEELTGSSFFVAGTWISGGEK